MDTLMSGIEDKDASKMELALALTRSAWQDVHENRRKHLAGKQSFKLINLHLSNPAPRQNLC